MTQALRPAHADDGTDEIPTDVQDAMGEIIAREAAEQAAAINEMTQALEGGNEAETPSSEETSLDSETTSDETGPRATSSETGRNSDEARRPGIDQALRSVESQVGKETADVFRSVLADRSRLSSEVTNMRDEWEDAQSELRESLAEVRGIAQGRQMNNPNGEPAAEGPVENDPWAQLSGEQQDLYRQLFDRYANEQGYVKAGEILAREQEQVASDYVNDAVDQGLDEFGSEFGYRGDDGKFNYSDDVASEVDAVHERIYDPGRGLTARDLYVLAKHDEIVSEAKDQATNAQNTTNQRQNRVDQARRGTVETRSSGGRGEPTIYKRGDSIENAVARAAAAAYRDLPIPSGAKK